MVTIDEEAGRTPSTTPLLVGAHESTGFSDSTRLTTSEYGAVEVNYSKVPAECSRSSITMAHTRGGKSTERAITYSH